MSATLTPAPPRAPIEDLDQYLPLVAHVVGQVSSAFPRHADREELAGAATLGLVEAASRFDPSRGVPFAAWACRRIRGAILDQARSADFAPRKVRSAGRLLSGAEAALTAELGRSPSDAETATRLGVTPRQLADLRAKVHRSLVVSLDEVRRGGNAQEDSGFTRWLVDADMLPCEELERRELDAYVADAVALLPDRMRIVVEDFFLKGRPSQELAAEMGISEGRVSQLRGEALRVLREGIAAQYEERRAATASARTSTVSGVGAAAASRRAAYADSIAQRSSFAQRITPRQVV